MAKIFLAILLLIILFLIFSTKKSYAVVGVLIKNHPAEIYREQEFEIKFAANDDSSPINDFSVKGRIGTSSAMMNQAETFNLSTSQWLSDSSAWSSFPTATDSVKLKTKATALGGQNILIIRINRAGKNYDSTPVNIFILEQISTPAPTMSPTVEEITIPTPTNSRAPVSYDNIYISEAMVNPQPGEKEWVEIYNNNDYSVFLSNWFIDDIENAGSSPKIFSLEILPKDYGLFEIGSSMFNNAGDSVRLLDFDKNLKSSFEYGSSTAGKTWGRVSVDEDDYCLQEPSKLLVNNNCLNPTPTAQSVSPSSTSKQLSTTRPTITRIKSLSSAKTTDSIILPVPALPAGRRQAGRIIESVHPAGSVLGFSTTQTNNLQPTKLLIKSLSSISFLYSLLTITSVFLKIKNVY